MSHYPAIHAGLVAGLFGLAISVTQSAGAAACNVSGATVTAIGTVLRGSISATSCDGSIDGNLRLGLIEGALESEALFDGDDKHLDWVYHGRIDDGGVEGDSVGSTLDDASGTWLADFTASSTEPLALLMKGANAYSVFVWLPPTLGIGGSRFDGAFNMALTGLGERGLSHIDVAGILTSTATLTRIPAALPLILTGLLCLGFLARRRRSVRRRKSRVRSVTMECRAHT